MSPAAPEGRVLLLVGGDLQARARLEPAADAAGMRLDTTSAEALQEALESLSPEVVVLDLDAEGTAVLGAVAAARRSGISLGRVVGFYSHVDAPLGEAARRAGCEAHPRGRFWRSLPDLLTRGPDD
jgi:hypothetical protein